MAAQFEKHQVEHRLIGIQGGEHGLAGVDPKIVSETYSAAAAFLEKHLGK
jgi:hypothetical protein